jgi:hypothetical protein
MRHDDRDVLELAVRELTIRSLNSSGRRYHGLPEFTLRVVLVDLKTHAAIEQLTFEARKTGFTQSIHAPLVLASRTALQGGHFCEARFKASSGTTTDGSSHYNGQRIIQQHQFMEISRQTALLAIKVGNETVLPEYSLDLISYKMHRLAIYVYNMLAVYKRLKQRPRYNQQAFIDALAMIEGGITIKKLTDIIDDLANIIGQSRLIYFSPEVTHVLRENFFDHLASLKLVALILVNVSHEGRYSILADLDTSRVDPIIEQLIQPNAHVRKLFLIEPAKQLFDKRERARQFLLRSGHSIRSVANFASRNITALVSSVSEGKTVSLREIGNMLRKSIDYAVSPIYTYVEDFFGPMRAQGLLNTTNVNAMLEEAERRRETAAAGGREAAAAGGRETAAARDVRLTEQLSEIDRIVTEMAEDAGPEPLQGGSTPRDLAQEIMKHTKQSMQTVKTVDKYQNTLDPKMVSNGQALTRKCSASLPKVTEAELDDILAAAEEIE